MAQSSLVSSWLYLLFTLLVGCIAIPVCLNWIIKFYHFKDDRRFRKRHGKLSTFTALCFVGELFSGALLTLAFCGFITNKTIVIMLAWSGDILNLISYFLIIHCLVLRFWCLYYDVRYQISDNDNLWKSMLDEHYVVNEQHLSEVRTFDIEDDLWFIKNKNRHGNSRWMLKTWFTRSILIVLLVLFVLIGIDLMLEARLVLRRGVIEVIFTCLFLIPWFLMIYIYHKIPQFFDTYSIRQEIVWIHNIDLIDVIASAVVSIVANYGIVSSNSNSNATSSNPYQNVLGNDYLNVLMIVTVYVMGISHTLIVYISTQWVRHKIIEDQQHIDILHQRAHSKQHEYLRLDEILRHQYGYELFMEHLKNEFSIENLLSLTEFIQYKHMMKGALGIKEDDDDIDVLLPMDYIPKSTIVYGQPHTEYDDEKTTVNRRKSTIVYGKTHNEEQLPDEPKDYRKYANIVYKLYCKYIRNGGDLEVNVSWERRKAFNQYIDYDNESLHGNILLSDNEYYTIFDGCILEVERLMKNDSYARFTHTDKYMKFKKAMKKQLSVS